MKILAGVVRVIFIMAGWIMLLAGAIIILLTVMWLVMGLKLPASNPGQDLEAIIFALFTGLLGWFIVKVFSKKKQNNDESPDGGETK